MEYSNDIKDVFKSIEKYNAGKEKKVLIDFDYMIADMISNKSVHSIVTELFVRDWKLNNCLVFITESYFHVPKDVRLSTTHLLQQNHAHFESLILLFHYIICCDFARIYWEKYRE